MRTPVKFRIAFFAITILTFVLGFNLLPETLDSIHSRYLTALFAAAYFVLIPVLYWLWIIKIGGQKAWKILLIISLCFAVARYSFPTEIAEHFEFIMWLRYPIIAILLAIEFYLIFHVVGSLWKARHLKGDPRIHVIEKYQDENEKKLLLGVLMSYEPASWYYAIPRFSRNHPQALGNLKLLSAHMWFWILLLLSTVLGASLAYLLLVDLSELAALIVASLISYSVIIVTANYRLSKYFSVYCLEDKLVLNNNILGFLTVPLNAIASIELGNWDKSKHKEKVLFGRGKQANVKIQFTSEQQYISGMGQFVESFSEVFLVLEDPDKLLEWGRSNSVAQSAPNS